MMTKTNSANLRVNGAALLVSTQVYENYAFDDEGNLDTDNPYWKAKGGSDILVSGVDADATPLEIQYIMDAVRDQIECDNGAYQEYILGWKLVPENFQFGDWQDQFIQRIQNPRNV